MGEWCDPDYQVLLSDVLGSPSFGLTQGAANRLVVALEQTGFLVQSPYYVPDVRELHEMYRQLAEVDYQGGGRVNKSWIRWVMCRETQQALMEKYRNVRVPRLPGITAWVDEGDRDHPIEVMNDLLMVWEARVKKSLEPAMEAGRLFDMPIRWDPAARRPMWEFIPEQERSR